MLGVMGDLRTRNRSVDEYPAYFDDTMNVWQTLEAISGNNLRKKYHYEGYNDVGNVLGALTTSSHRRDSFAEKATSADHPSEYEDGSETCRAKAEQVESNEASNRANGKKKKRARGRKARQKAKTAKLLENEDEKDELKYLSLKCTDLVQCSFNIPKISARLERLMGTNVVRLTDRKYMKELRERIDEDYRLQLSNRIKNREIKELERERNLILEGKTDSIPEELSADPIFIVNKRANIEIAKRRAKLKTNREKNAERLLRQGLKWERERTRHEEQERQKQKELERIRKEQKELEEKYMEEDAQRGLDLLRINDTEWQECENNLRDFLKSERNKMKERSWRISKPYSSDPMDIQNIVRARKKFRETEKRIRLQLEGSLDEKSERSAKHFANKLTLLMSAVEAFSTTIEKQSPDTESQASLYLGDDDASGIQSSNSSSQQNTSSHSDIRQQKVQEMESQMDSDTQKGYLVTKEQHSYLRYDDLQMAKLREAKTIRELYQIAEKIIIGEIEEYIANEEVEIEEEDNENKR